jgi:hypothetical protein
MGRRHISETQMTTFNLKQVTVPLFGAVETNTDHWLDAFSMGATTPVQIDSAAFDLIADELELDAEGLAGDADRYVSGAYRTKARGMGGARLGDLGEILAFLVNRAVHGREIVRVVSWRADVGQTVKGSRFPQPDFIFSDSGNPLAALEVKSTEAFDFTDLRDTKKKWTWLQPCSSVSGCRAQALPQLAYVNGSFTPQLHSLRVRNGNVVPFPVGKGVAAAVVAVDGRINTLRTDARFRTPKNCRESGRNCWSCVSATCHFALVTMPNAPGALSLAGASRDSSADWLRAYRRWSEALAARDLFAVRSTLGPLGEAISVWLDRSEVHEADVLRAFWFSYLGDAMRTRGFDIEAPRQLGELRLDELGFGWSPARLPPNPIREASLEEVQRLLGDQDAQVFDSPFMLSVRLAGDRQPNESLAVGVVGDFFVFRLASSAWWSGEGVASTDAASGTAERLFAVALGTTDPRLPAPGKPLPLQELVAHVGEQAIPLGWESKSDMLGSEGLWRRWADWPFWFVPDRRGRLPWPALLALGDPRTRLRVLRDGRAELRVHKTLLMR